MISYRYLWSMRNFIHINLCVSLILAQLTFVIGVTPHEGGGSVVGGGAVWKGGNALEGEEVEMSAGDKKNIVLAGHSLHCHQ